MARLDHKQQQTLAITLATRRHELGLSVREVGRRANLDNGTIGRLEHGTNPNPSMDSLSAIAVALELPASDLLAITGSLPKNELPTFKPYMRARYPNMPDSALADIATYAEKIAKEHGGYLTGPLDGEDEQDE